MAIVITDDDARRHLSMKECIEAMRVAFRDYALGSAIGLLPPMLFATLAFDWVIAQFL